MNQTTTTTTPTPDDDPFALRPPTGSITPHILLVIVQIAALSGPKFPSRNALVSAAIVGLAVACHASQFTSDLGLANFTSLAWPHYLFTLSNFLFASSPAGPEGDLWPTTRPERVALTLRAWSPGKVYWCLGTLFGLRGVGWNYEVENLPRRVGKGEREGRTRFLVLQMVDLVWVVLMGDLISQLGRKLFFVDPETGLLYVDSRGLTLRSDNLWLSLAKAFVFGAGPYFFINLQYIVCSIVWVGLGFGSPENWPPLFGHLSEATTVRRFWNRFWHQMIRKGLTSYSTAFARSLGLTKGTTLYKYTNLFTAFTISGVMHAASLLILPSAKNIPVQERSVGLFLFFFYQAMAITLEDLVQWLYEKISGSPPKGYWTSMVGYSWVAVSFWFSLPLAGDVMLKLRMGQDAPLPFSVFKPLVEKVPLSFRL